MTIKHVDPKPTNSYDNEITSTNWNSDHLIEGNLEIPSGQDLVLSAGNISTDITTGTVIGTVGGASGQKLAFFGEAPIVQPILDTGAEATVDDVITVLQALGLVRQTPVG